VLQWTASTCVPAFDRTRCDSGALLVGAGRANDSARLPGSSFGTRVDLHAWGEEVTTLGYGDLVTKVPPPVPPELRYTGIFSGTSAATAIVAGGAASLAPSFPGGKPDPANLMSVLKDSGVRGAPSPDVGPLPDLKAALAELERRIKAGTLNATLPPACPP
jgi:hypothetical protein